MSDIGDDGFGGDDSSGMSYEDRRGRELREGGRSMVTGGLVLIFLGALVAWWLGNDQAISVPDSFSDEQFNYTLALLAFGPFFIVGGVMASLGAVVRRLPI